MNEKLQSSLRLPGWMDRTVQLLGEEKCMILHQSNILIAGIGGVGSTAAEALVRAGIGALTIVDTDSVQLTNINRQIPALHSTIGNPKVEVLGQRLMDINPELKLKIQQTYISEESIDAILSDSFSFIVDAIDTLSPKILLIKKVLKENLPLASSMGSGGKTDPSKISITDFGKTYNCKLAYLLRKKLRKDGINGGFKVVFSTELVDKERVIVAENERNKKSVVGTISYIPMIFGSMLASIVVDELTRKNRSATD